jgi:ribosomal protein S18 acetylase RimI-like enzyme
MLIRLATANDVTDVIDCARSAYSKYIERVGREPAPMLADYTAQIEQGIVWVLTEQGDVRGLLVSFPQNDCYFIENVAVRPDFQGNGYGKKLMTFAAEQARAVHLAEICLYTNIAMTENLIFYSKLGFEEIERKIENGYHRVYLRKRLEGK